MKILLCLMTFALAVPTHAQTNAEMNAAAMENYETADQGMNTAYQKLMKILHAEGQKRLKETQRAWLAYRDAQAGFDSHHFAGGTAEMMEKTGSLTLLTKERTKRLQEDYTRFQEINQ